MTSRIAESKGGLIRQCSVQSQVPPVQPFGYIASDTGFAKSLIDRFAYEHHTKPIMLPPSVTSRLILKREARHS